MAKINIPITQGFYESYSLPISAQRCQNMFVHDTGFGEALISVAGIKGVASTGSNISEANRGLHNKSGLAYAVNNQALYLVSRSVTTSGVESYSLTVLGAIPGSGNVKMADNGSQLIIINSDGDGWIYDENAGTPFQSITDPDFKANGNPTDVVFLDGYFVLSTDEKKIIISSLNDGLAYNALDFAAAEADPDAISALQVVNNQLIVIGERTTEVFTNRGGAAFPFQRVNGLVMNIGTTAPNSVVKVGQSFFMLGSSGTGSDTAYMFNGNSYQEVANPGISRLIEVSDITDSSSTSYGYLGAEFAACSFGGATIVYNTKSGKWHERNLSVNGGRIVRSVIGHAIEAYGRLLVGSAFDGSVGVMSLDEYKDFGFNIQRVVSSPRFSDKLVRKSLPRLEVLAESGEITAGQSAVVVGMSISKDGGKTYGYPRFRTLGAGGEFSSRAVWRRNGSFNKGFIVKFETDADAKVVLIEVVADIL